MEKKSKQKFNFYELLELDKSATTDEIKTQYKKLALKWHPDKNNNSEESTEKFKIISEAYSGNKLITLLNKPNYKHIVLSNKDRRAHYDKYGTVEDDMMDEENFFKEFEEMFGGGGGSMFFEHFDEFTDFLESDTKYMRKMFRDVGKDVRIRGKRRKQGGKSGLGGANIDELLSFFMMPGMGMGMPGMGMGGSKKSKDKKKQTKKKESEEEGGWETEEEELDNEDGVEKKKKNGEDEGWETLSEDDEK